MRHDKLDGSNENTLILEVLWAEMSLHSQTLDIS
jgi:hypothetical protein